MKRRVDRKPTDPKMLVHVPRRAGEEALTLLRQTFGPHAPAPVEALVAALERGIAQHAPVIARRTRSPFSALLRQSPITITAPNRAHARALKNQAHNWARYHGVRVATRQHPRASAITVYLVQGAA